MILGIGRWRRRLRDELFWRYLRRFPALTLIETLPDNEKSWDKNHRKAGRSDHSGEHANPQGLARVGACSGRKDKRQYAKDKGKGRHEDWPETYPRGINRRLEDRLAINNAVLARNFHDQ